MAKTFDLDKLTYAELKDLRDRVDEAMVDAKASEKRSIRAKMEALAAESGFTVAELLGGGRRGAAKGTPAIVKYRNPKDPTQTWSGRGRKPNWLVEVEAKGMSLDKFLV